MAGRTPEDIESERRVLLVTLFATVGSSILVVFGGLALLSDRVGLAMALLVVALLCLSLMLYSRRTGRSRDVSYLLSALAFLLGVFLIMHGGVEGTGVYFAFPVAIIMVMAGFTSVRFTMSICALFLAVVALGLYGPYGQDWIHPYSLVEKSRIMVALSALVLLAVLAEWMRVRSYSATVDTHEQLSVDARLDPLTGLLNRRGFEEAIAGLPPGRFPAVIGLLDLDHFKAVNDVHGHDAGDEVIRAFADHLRRNLKGRDLLCRWGGEEFVVLVTQTRPDEAWTVLDAIRRGFAATRLSIGDVELRVTFSAGLAGLRDASGFESALTCADECLYRAKDAGRNRLQLAQVDSVQGLPEPV